MQLCRFSPFLPCLLSQCRIWGYRHHNEPNHQRSLMVYPRIYPLLHPAPVDKAETQAGNRVVLFAVGVLLCHDIHSLLGSIRRVSTPHDAHVSLPVPHGSRRVPFPCPGTFLQGRPAKSITQAVSHTEFYPPTELI